MILPLSIVLFNVFCQLNLIVVFPYLIKDDHIMLINIAF